ncbi:MAG: type I DNA topoisomerase, partial [Planctomycetia bacterium]|nr:type I DNA topoisomerase [Planctomycetia bacterium]
MAKKASAAKRSRPSGKPLVIVESPAKAKTIRGFLGSDYNVEASVGHIRDLPHNAEEIPKELKKESWAKLGVNVDQDFEPLYIVSPEKRKQVAKLKDLLSDASALYLATDEDREGEAISWHLAEVLKPKVDVHRLVFHEITRKAILDSLEHPRGINESLVNAQETRRIVDRLYGYEVSPLLWKKVGRGLSAGRVQSVAVRLLVDRERQRMAFRSGTWWDLSGTFAAGGAAAGGFEARLATLDGRPLARGADFDAATGRLKNDRVVLLDEPQARSLEARLRKETFTVASREDRPFTQRPSAPFTTSSLQQEANRKCGFTAKRTMQIAQGLYENGHITYMRTDSTNLAAEAVAAVRRTVERLYGADHLPPAPRIYQTKVANAQEAHEAIRPAGSDMPTPDQLRGSLDADGFRLYELIWKRTVACQMADARGQQTTLSIVSTAHTGPAAGFQAGGKTIEFAGFLRAYVEGSDDPQADLADKETILPPLGVGQPVDCRSLEAASHATQPPARYTEATLTKALEEKGIGRPSTYASTIDTILKREYCRKRGNALVPTWVGFAVCQLLVDHLPALVDYQFTAQMEEDLDAISRGEGVKLDYLRRFYFGNGRAGLKDLLATSTGQIDARAASSIQIPATAPGVEGIVVRVGRYGPFIEQDGRRASLPPEDKLAPDELTPDKCAELLAHSARAEAPLGTCPKTGLPVFAKNGRFGPYVQLGVTGDDEKPKSSSLLPGMSLETLDLSTALRLLELPRTLGVHPSNGEEIKALNGKFGPYISCAGDSRSLPAGLSPLDVTLEQAVELLAQPKLRGKRSFGAAAAPLKSLGTSPVTGKSVDLRS